MNKKAVIFDLDDTLLWDDRAVKEAFEITCLKASISRGINPIELEVAVRSEARKLYESYETYPFTQMIGINPFEALWGRFTEGNHPMFRNLQSIAPQYRKDSWTAGLILVGVNDEQYGQVLGDMFAEVRRTLAYVYDDTYFVLESLFGKVKLLLLTNGSPDLQKEKLAGVPRLAPFFNHIIISGDFGRGKPDPAIFEHAINLMDINPTEGIMIGDKLTTDILGSHRIGMDNIWINHHNADVGEHVAPTHTVTQLKQILELI